MLRGLEVPLKRLDVAFTQRNPVLKWDDISQADLHKCLIEEFGAKQTDISQVLAQFSRSCFKKTSNMTVSDF